MGGRDRSSGPGLAKCGSDSDREKSCGLENDAAVERGAVVFEFDVVVSRRNGDGKVAGVGDEHRDPPAVETGLPGREACPPEDDVASGLGGNLYRSGVRLDSRRRKSAASLRSFRSAIRTSGKHDVRFRQETLGTDEIERAGKEEPPVLPAGPAQLGDRIRDLREKEPAPRDL
jgi:hypothetical protein